MRPSVNPFRVSALAKQRFIIDEDVFTRLLQRVRSCQYRACIPGPHGTGKSTLLEDMAMAFRAEGQTVNWVYLNMQMSRKKRNTAMNAILNSDGATIHCLDGGETIGGLQWWWFLIRGRLRNIRLLATVHNPICPLPIVYRTRVDISCMRHMVRRLAGNHWSEELETLAMKTHRIHNGNCREVFHACYLYCSDI